MDPVAPSSSIPKPGPSSGRKVALLVCGMHRSGTSALARTFNLLGAGLPADLVPANHGNLAGHWEPAAVVGLNDEMLREARSDLYSVVPIDDRWLESPAAHEFRGKAAALLTAEYGGADLIVIKDPRLCLLAPIWRDALSGLGYRVLAVLPLRAPEAVASSLRRRHVKELPYDAWPAPRGELVWLRYTLAAERFTRDLPRAFLRFDALLDDWRGTIDEAAASLGLELPERTPEAENAVEAFLRGEMKGEDPPPQSPTGFGRPEELDGAGLASAMYRLCLEAVGRPDALDTAEVDRVAAVYSQRMAGCRDILTTLEGSWALVWRYYVESQAAQAASGEAHPSLAVLRDGHARLWAELERLSGEREALRQDVATWRLAAETRPSAGEEQERSLRAGAAALSAGAAKAHELALALADSVARARWLDRELEGVRARNTDLERTEAALTEEVAARRAEAAELAAELTACRARTEAWEADGRAGRGDVEARDAPGSATREELAARLAEQEAAAGRLAAEIARLRATRAFRVRAASIRFVRGLRRAAKSAPWTGSGPAG